MSEAFPNQDKKTSSEWMIEALEALDDVTYKFTIFVDHFKKSLAEAGVFENYEPKT